MREQAYIVAYDISCNRRRGRVARWLEARGERLQKSLFVCRLTPRAADRLRAGLQARTDAAEDRLLVEPMAGRGFERARALIL